MYKCIWYTSLTHTWRKLVEYKNENMYSLDGKSHFTESYTSVTNWSMGLNVFVRIFFITLNQPFLHAKSSQIALMIAFGYNFHIRRKNGTKTEWMNEWMNEFVNYVHWRWIWWWNSFSKSIIYDVFIVLLWKFSNFF